MTSLNTSYERKYVVVSRTETSVVLRVQDRDLYRSYWMEFISASAARDASPMYLRVEQIPPTAELVDQFSNFSPELPIVTLEVDGRRYDATSKVVSNAPNTETPGLYRIDYRINLHKDVSSIFWSSYVSIQQRPLLRRAAGGWVRDSYILKTLNRLVMEPQFMEALHAAGEPLYGFMQANQHPAIKASQLPKYADIEAWGAGGAPGDSAIFITGPKLPQGSIVIYQQRILQLREPVYPDAASGGSHMNLDDHERTSTGSVVGDVCRIGKSSYICVADADADISRNDTRYWREGYLYRFSTQNGSEIALPRRRLPFGNEGVRHIWAAVDSLGYQFWVDVSHVASLGAYRGHYDRRNFADYATGDIVSYVTGDSMRLFARKATAIQDPETLIYPPGHYLNPAWEEIYCHMADDPFPLLSEYYVIPHSNATNAIVAKTWSVSEEMCRAYAHLSGIPDTIVEACGAKWSALLFALLVRTRNTFDGLRICMQAVGLDVRNLRLSEPSIEYWCRPEGESEEARVDDIYAQHANLLGLARNIATLEPAGKWTDEEGALRYDPDDPGAIQQYSGGEWITRYRMGRVEPSQNFNNRYFDGDLEVLARLAEDAIKDLGDGKEWVKAPAWSGEYSLLTSDVIAYEIPIYVWIRIHMYLYDESKIEMETAVHSGVLDGQRCGGRNVIELFPSAYFSRVRHSYIEIPTGVFRQENGEWAEIAPTRRNEKRGSKIYEFDSVQYPIRIRALDMASNIFIKYWRSAHTFGLLGLASSESTDRFRDVTDPEADDKTDLMLANGYVGVTALYRAKDQRIAQAQALTWMYVLKDDESTWHLSETVPFADWADVDFTDLYPYEGGLEAFKAALDSIWTSARGGDEIQYAWDNNVLVLKDAFPERLYFRNAEAEVIAALTLAPGAYTIMNDEWGKMETSGHDSVRITFEYQ